MGRAHLLCTAATFPLSIGKGISPSLSSGGLGTRYHPSCTTVLDFHCRLTARAVEISKTGQITGTPRFCRYSKVGS